MARLGTGEGSGQSAVERIGSIASLAIQRPVTTAMVFLGLALLGLLSYQRLPLQLMPDYTFPRVYVQVFYQGATPEAVEQDVLRQLEGEIATLAGVKEISSTARVGSGTVDIAFERGVDVSFAALRVDQRVARALEGFPETVFVDVQRFDTSTFANFVMVLSFRGSADIETMKKLADDQIVPVLSGVEGVVQVTVQGGAAKQIGVFLEPDRARARGVGVTEVRQAMQDATTPVVAVGHVEDGGRRLPVQLDGRASRLADVADAPVGGRRAVKLSHVADIRPGVAGSVERYRVDGQTSVGLYVFKDQQTNLIEVAHRLRDSIEDFNDRHRADGLELSIDFDAAEIMEKELDKLKRRAGAGALLALVVLLVFLGAQPLTVALAAVPSLLVALDVMALLSGRFQELVHDATPWLAASVFLVVLVRKDARSVATVALALPVSLLVACSLFQWAGLTLNVLTLLGLALAVGMLLDNGIVVLEAIAARRERGDDALAGARRGATQVQRAVIAGTVTTLVVFVPLWFVDFDESKLFEDLALAVCFPLVASLLVAVALLPMLASRIRGGPAREAALRLPGRFGMPRPDAARMAYSVILRWSLRHPSVTAAGFAILILLTFTFGVPLLVLFADPARPPEKTIELKAESQPGTPIEAVDQVATQLEALADGLPQVDEVRTSVREEEAKVTIVFKDEEDRTGPVNVDAVRRKLRRKARDFDAADLEVDPPSAYGGGGGGGGLGEPGGSQETVRVIGPDSDRLHDVARRVKETLEQVPGLRAVTWDTSEPRAVLTVTPDRTRLAEYGLTTMELMAVLWAARREGAPARYPFKLGEEDVDLVLWVEGGDEREVEDVREFPLTTGAGARIPMRAVSTVSTGSEPPDIKRWQRQRTVTIRYGFERSVTGSSSAIDEVRASVGEALERLSLPAGYAAEPEHATDALAPAKRLLTIGFLLVVVALAIAFESLILPFLVILCVPLALVGVVWLLVLTGTSVNMYVMLAAVVLLGIVVNNGILFVDRSQSLLAAGARRTTAIFRAAHDRLRPVLMTTATTIVGMLPLAVSTGGQQEVWPPFGRAVIGGLTASTLISLVLVPVGTLLLGKLSDTAGRVSVPRVVAALAFTAGAVSYIQLHGHFETWNPMGLQSAWPAWLALPVFAGTFLAASVLPGWLRAGLTALGLTVASLCVAWQQELIVSTLATWLLFLPLLLGIFGLIRAAQRWVTGERPPDFVGEGPVDVRVHNVRKIYGGLPRIAREYSRVHRWRERAERAGLLPTEIDSPAAGRRRLTILVGLLSLLVMLHVLTESTWGLFFLSLATMWVVDGGVGSLLTIARKPRAWPLSGLWGKLWPASLHLGLWGYLFLRRREGAEQDVVVLVLAAIVLLPGVILHLVGRGGYLGQIRRWLAPEPVVALGGVSLDFEEGLYGLLGPNGAGKSTLMRVAVNVFDTSRGEVRVNGRELQENVASLQSKIGYLPQFFGVPPRLTAREYLQHHALLAGVRSRPERAELVESVLSEVGLANRADEALGGFSGGMRQRVGIARTLLNVPRIVVVDEPTVGLDPRERIRFRNLLAELAKSRIVILSTHVVEDIGSACREVIVLDGGDVLFRGPPADMVKKAEGEAWTHELAEADLDAVSAEYRVVTSTRVPGGRVRVRGVGPRPEGAEDAQPTLEDAYLLLLGRPVDEVEDAA